MALEFEVVPEQCLRHVQCEFTIGQQICTTLYHIQRCVKLIKSVHLLYSNATPNDKDVIVDLTHEKIRLLFEPVSQQLRVRMVCFLIKDNV